MNKNLRRQIDYLFLNGYNYVEGTTKVNILVFTKEVKNKHFFEYVNILEPHTTNRIKESMIIQRCNSIDERLLKEFFENETLDRAKEKYIEVIGEMKREISYDERTIALFDTLKEFKNEKVSKHLKTVITNETQFLKNYGKKLDIVEYSNESVNEF